MTTFFNTAGEIFFTFMAKSLPVNSVFMVLIFAVLYFAKMLPAAIRYRLGMIALVKVYIPPLFVLPVLPPLLLQVEQQPLPVSPGPQLMAAEGVISEIPVLAPDAVIFLIWLSIAALFTSYMAYKTLRFKNSLRHCRYVETRIFGLREITIFKHETIAMPFSFGLHPGAIYVPADWQSWPPQSQKLVLEHEFAHIRRGDGWMQAFQLLTQILFFFHPLVWLLNRQINAMREMVCDEITIDGNKMTSLVYSRYLIKIAECKLMADIGCAPASALIRQRNQLVQRIQYLLEDKKMKKNPKHAIQLCFCLLFMFFSVQFTRAVQVPESSMDRTEKQTISIKLSAKKGLLFEGKQTSLKELGPFLKNTAGGPEKVVVDFYVDPVMPMGKVKAVQDVLRDAGILNVHHKSKGEKDTVIILPPAGEFDIRKQVEKKNLCTILINQPGELLVDEEPMAKWKMAEYVKKRQIKNSDLVVDITTSKTTEFMDYIQTVELVKKAGVYRISVFGQHKKKPIPAN